MGREARGLGRCASRFLLSYALFAGTQSMVKMVKAPELALALSPQPIILARRCELKQM